MRFLKIPITILIVFATATVQIVEDSLFDETFFSPSDSFEISLTDSSLGINWDSFDLDFDSAKPKSSYPAGLFNDLTADYPLEESELDILNDPAVINNDPNGLFFDAPLSDIFASIPAYEEANLISEGQTTQAGCSESEYPADLCCLGPLGRIIDETNNIATYSEIQNCYYSELSMFSNVSLYIFCFAEKKENSNTIMMTRANRFLRKVLDQIQCLLLNKCCKLSCSLHRACYYGGKN